MSSMALFIAAAGSVSAIIYWMMTRLGDSRPTRRSAHDGAGPDTGVGGGSSGDGWNLSSWFSSDSSSSHSSGSSSDSGGSGGGSGGEGGGGGGD